MCNNILYYYHYYYRSAVVGGELMEKLTRARRVVSMLIIYKDLELKFDGRRWLTNENTANSTSCQLIRDKSWETRATLYIILLQVSTAVVCAYRRRVYNVL